MTFEVELLPSAEGDLDWYRDYQQKVILDAVATFLEAGANIEMRRRKRLRDNRSPPGS